MPALSGAVSSRLCQSRLCTCWTSDSGCISFTLWSVVQYFKFAASNPISIKTKVRAAVCGHCQKTPLVVLSGGAAALAWPPWLAQQLALICSPSGAEQALCSHHHTYT